MKVSHKLLPLGLLASTLCMVAPLARAEVGPTANQSEALVAQVGVTRDALQQVIAKLKSTGEQLDDGMAHADFLAKSRIFGDRVNAAMTTFESTMSTRILKMASVWVDRMKKIDASPAYSPEQKAEVLKSQYAQAEAQFTELTKEYQTALNELYLSVLPRVNFVYESLDRTTRFCDDNNPLSKVFFWAMGHSCRGFERRTTEIELRFRMSILGGYGDPAFTFPTTTLKTSEFYSSLHGYEDNEVAEAARGLHPYELDAKLVPALATWISEQQISFGCYSASCIPLYVSQISSFISLVRSTLDKDIVFHTAKGALTLKGLARETRYMISYLRTDQKVVSQLPFEITDTENRAATIAQLTGLVLDPNVDFERCPVAVTRLNELLCRAEEVPGRGCLTTAEKSDLVSQIEKLSHRGKAKKQRKACLETAAPAAS